MYGSGACFTRVLQRDSGCAGMRVLLILQEIRQIAQFLTLCSTYNRTEALRISSPWQISSLQRHEPLRGLFVPMDTHLQPTTKCEKLSEESCKEAEFQLWSDRGILGTATRLPHTMDFPAWHCRAKASFVRKIIPRITVCAAFAPIPVSHAKTAQHIPGNRYRDTRLCIGANTAVPRAWEDR